MKISFLQRKAFTIIFLLLAAILSIERYNFFQYVFAAEATDKINTQPEKNLLLSYYETQNLSGEEEGISILIYQDGYTFIGFPYYMKQAGNYSVNLDPIELDQIWSLFVTSNILEFDDQLVNSEILTERQVRRDTQTLFTTVADTSNIKLTIFPNRYKSAGYKSGDYNEIKKIYWSGLAWHAREFPNIQMTQSLAAVQKTLLSVMTHSNLRKID